jgi:hypothetical protein
MNRNLAVSAGRWNTPICGPHLAQSVSAQVQRWISAGSLLIAAVLLFAAVNEAHQFALMLPAQIGDGLKLGGFVRLMSECVAFAGVMLIGREMAARSAARNGPLQTGLRLIGAGLAAGAFSHVLIVAELIGSGGPTSQLATHLAAIGGYVFAVAAALVTSTALNHEGRLRDCAAMRLPASLAAAGFASGALSGAFRAQFLEGLGMAGDLPTSTVAFTAVLAIAAVAMTVTSLLLFATAARIKLSDA